MNTFNNKLLVEFLEESIDSLAPIANFLIQIETTPNDINLINSIFAPIHSLKGNAAFFGFAQTKLLAHTMENLLDRFRTKTISPSKYSINILLNGLDMLDTMLQNIKNKKENEIDDEKSFNDSIESINNILDEDSDQVSLLLEIEKKFKIITPFIPEDKTGLWQEILKLSGLLKTTQPAKIKEDNIKYPEVLNTVIDILNEPEFDSLEEEQKKVIYRSFAVLEKSSISSETLEKIKELRTQYDEYMEDIEEFDSFLAEILLEKFQDLKESGIWILPEQDTLPDKQLDISIKEVDENINQSKTMRVEESSVDSFLEYVGELVVVEEMLSYIQRELAVTEKNRNLINVFKQTLETFDILSDNLRKSILTIRKVPINNILQKAPRIVHDLTLKLNKKINVIIEGENINIDKRYVDLLDAPMVHMVRNSIDHGIEDSAHRLQMEKSEYGTIRISVKEDAQSITMIIEDDGKGLNLKKLKEKAVKNGIISPTESLAKDQIIKLLFKPGISTAETITDLSGRGVGMDVVHKHIMMCGGNIFVDTVPEQGTTITITMPTNITTQILKGFLIRAGNEIYVLPMQRVSESFAATEQDIKTIKEKQKFIVRHDTSIPIIELAKKLNLNNWQEFYQEQEKMTFVVVTINHKSYALRVEEIIGVHKVVVKKVEGDLINSQIFDGAAIVGDGSVSMIIGEDGLKHLTSG